MMERAAIDSITIATVLIALIQVTASPAKLMAQDRVPVKIQVDPATVVSRISPNFIGFGYESSAVAQTNYFSGGNKSLIQLYRNLTDRGLIRVGGCASDNTQYAPDAIPVARDFRQVSILNKKSITDLADFSQATGWKVMWGLNLGNGTRDQAVTEAVAVDAALGSQLHSFQIGNEVEALARFKGNYDAYHEAYLDYKSGIRAVLPHSYFSGPDSIGHWDWITRFAATDGGDIKLLTHHYYCSDAHAPNVSIEKMLTHDDRFEKRLQDLDKLSRESGIGYRINEVNSFSSGGKPGVSDTFASALWCLDYMYELASHGCNGVNIETDINHLNFMSHYSPIVHDAAGKCTARPDYYGMLAFSVAAKGDLVKLTLDKTDINLSAYAAKDSTGEVRIAVINKDLAKDGELEVSLPTGYSKADVIWLRAPSARSADHITLAGAAVVDDNTWTSGPAEQMQVAAGAAALVVPRATAAFIHFKM